MKVGIEVRDSAINRIFKIINDHINDTISMDELLLEVFKEGVSCSDYLFLILSHLEKHGNVKGKAGKVKVEKTVSRSLQKEIKESTQNQL